MALDPLFLEYFIAKDIGTRNILVTRNIGLVRTTARKLSRECRVPYDDLEQAGSIGLIKAVERFDPGKERSFSTLAVPYIRGSILQYLRDKGSLIRVPRPWQDIYQQVKGEVKRTGDREIDVAKRKGISESDWRQYSLAMQGYVLPLHPEIAEELFRTEEPPHGLSEDLQIAISRLEIGQSQVLTAIFFNKMSTRTAARTLSIPISRLEFKLEQALSALKNNINLNGDLSPQTETKTPQTNIDSLFDLLLSRPTASTP
jgi:RNA polymerase sigma-B factor